MLTVAMLRTIIAPPVAVAVGFDRAHRSPSHHTALGRSAARAALASLHVDASDLGSGPGGPAWPDGITGSIAHTDGLAAAIAARLTDRAGLGIDLERSDRLISERVLQRISTEAEREWLRALGDDMAVTLFCAKEATYKALSRFERHPISFADVSFEPRSPGLLAGSLAPTVAPFAHVREVVARTLIGGGYVVAVVEVEASPQSSSRADTERVAQDSR